MHINNKLIFFSAKFRRILLALVCAPGLSETYAANEINTLKDEPISPIPLTVETDKQKVQLGKSLFFDPRLSKNNSISCATCHQLNNGGDDNVAKGLSSESKTHVINTPSIFNARYNFCLLYTSDAADDAMMV